VVGYNENVVMFEVNDEIFYIPTVRNRNVYNWEDCYNKQDMSGWDYYYNTNNNKQNDGNFRNGKNNGGSSKSNKR